MISLCSLQVFSVPTTSEFRLEKWKLKEYPLRRGTWVNTWTKLLIIKQMDVRFRSRPNVAELFVRGTKL